MVLARMWASYGEGGNQVAVFASPASDSDWVLFPPLGDLPFEDLELCSKYSAGQKLLT